MKAELLKRLFRALANDDDEALKNLLATVIGEERKKGHTTLADQLENIAKKSSKNGSKPITYHEIQHLPPGLPQNIPPGLPTASVPPAVPSSGIPTVYRANGLTELPTSKRFKSPLVTSIPRDRGGTTRS